MHLPQESLEVVSGQLDWVHANINNNLDFIPDDKLGWKPAPTAKSVLEIISHATATVNMFTLAIKGEPQTELPPVKRREEAKSAISRVIEAHQAALRALGEDDMGRTVSLPIGDMPLGIVAGLPVVELINHHGQITYIQTLLGDSESHLVF